MKTTNNKMRNRKADESKLYFGWITNAYSFLASNKDVDCRTYFDAKYIAIAKPDYIKNINN